MTIRAKQSTLLLIGLVIIITALIGAGLPRLNLEPGMPVPSVAHGQLVIMPVEETPLVAFPLSRFAKIIFVMVLAGAMLFILYKLARGIGWKDLGAVIQPMLFGILIIGFILFFISMLVVNPQNAVTLELPMPEPTPLPTSPLGPVPPLLLWLVGIGVLTAGILLAFWLFGSPAKRPLTLDIVGREAEKAWQALNTGLSLKEVIIQCYRQMSLALQQEQGIEREDWMTTREFEDLLEGAGIPHAPVHQLTQLFEAVRYGDWQPNPLDREKAINCLEAIILHSRETKKPA